MGLIEILFKYKYLMWLFCVNFKLETRKKNKKKLFSRQYYTLKLIHEFVEILIFNDQKF